ncbi:MAG: hypothetical protein ACREJ2_07670 [Planctomycetota bacterium]
MTTAAATRFVSRLTEIVCRMVTAARPMQTAAGPFLADPSRTDPYPASAQDITLNRAIYALARLPDFDDPQNPYFDDAQLRNQAVRIGAYLAEVLGDSGGIPLAAGQSGVHQSGLRSLNFWTCPHVVRFWLKSLPILSGRLAQHQAARWRESLAGCLKLLSGRHADVGAWNGLLDADGPRLSAVAAAGAALWIGGDVLGFPIFSREGQDLWRGLYDRIQSGDDLAPLIDGLDIDAMLGTLNSLPPAGEDRRRCETRLAGWRARLTMPDGAINELFDRHRAHSRLGMGAAPPALLLHGHPLPAAAILHSFERRPRRGIQALPELATLVESIDALNALLPDAAAPGPNDADIDRRMEATYAGWIGGPASRAWLFRGNGWIAGCRAPVFTHGGCSCPFSVRHLRCDCWLDGSTPDSRRAKPLPCRLLPDAAADLTGRHLLVQCDACHGRFGLAVLDEQTLRLTIRLNWTGRAGSDRNRPGVQLLFAAREGQAAILREPSGRALELPLTLEAIQRECPSGHQLQLPAAAGRPAGLLAVHSNGPTPLLRWNLPPRAEEQRLPLPVNRLELSLPFAADQETRIDLILTVPR